MVYAHTSHNKRLAQNALLGHFGLRKKPVGASAFVAFCSTTFLLPCKTYGFAYSGSKNVANLERYA
jgi:hypothetical protein